MSDSKSLTLILDQNIILLPKIVSSLPILDKIAQDTVRICGFQEDKFRILYDLEMNSPGALKDGNIIIRPQDFSTGRIASAEDLRFIVAHEVGHSQYPRRLLRVIPLLVGVALSCWQRFSLESTLVISFSMVSSTLYLLRKEELWCDDYAASKIGVESGISSLTRMHQNVLEANAKFNWYQRILQYDWTHPSPLSRIKALRERTIVSDH